MVNNRQSPQTAAPMSSDDYEESQRFYKKGRRHLADGEWEAAVRCADQALSLRPDFAKAEELFNDAQRGRKAQLDYDRGLVFIRQGRLEEGIAELENAEASGFEFSGLQTELEEARQRLKAIEDESKGRRWLEEAEKLLNAGQLVEARRALKEADRLFPQGSPSREDLVKADTTLINEENERKQAIDSELERAKKAFDDYGRIEDELQKVRKRLRTLKGSGEYREDDIKDRVGKIEEILEHSPKPKLAVVMPILTFFLGILTLLFGQGILTSCLPQILPVAIPSIARVEVYMNGGQLDLDQLPSLTSGEEFMLEVVVLDTKEKRYTGDDLVCKWSVAPLGDKDARIDTTLCITPYTPSQEYSSQVVFVEVQGGEQQFKSSGYISMEFNITQQ